MAHLTSDAVRSAARPGVLTGSLPCGLSWGALALALTSRPVTGAAGLFVFGLATAPALLLVGFGARGLPGPLSAAEAALPECCREPAGE